MPHNSHFRNATAIAAATVFVAGFSMGSLPTRAAGECDEPAAEWLACEDFEGGDAGWSEWFSESPWVECLGCPGGVNNPARIRLANEQNAAHSGDWGLHMPADAEAGYQGAALTFRDCAGAKRPGCSLNGHDELYFRTWVRLAPDHEYVHHFLSVAGTRPNGYWDSDGNAGCRPDGVRWAGTTLDFNRSRELMFYTYFPEMRCDFGNYCSGDVARRICEGCAAKNMPCSSRQECCWGNIFAPEPPIELARDTWVCLEIGMRLNTPGESDGSMTFWVDGDPALQVDGMHWRDSADLQLNNAWLQHYIELGDASRSNQIWFDDVVVSTARIGCGSVPPTLEPPVVVSSTPTQAPTATATRTSESSGNATATSSQTPSEGATTVASATNTPRSNQPLSWVVYLPVGER